MEHKDKSLTGMVPVKEHPSWGQAFDQQRGKKSVGTTTLADGRRIEFWSDGTWTYTKPEATPPAA